jgi:DNA processing protein
LGLESVVATVTDRRYWIGFNLVPQIGPAKVQRLLEYFGDLPTAWTAGAHELAQAGLDKRALENLLIARRELDLRVEYDKARASCDFILTWEDPEYPRLLRQVPHPPPVLYIKGNLTYEDEWALAVVGTRRASAYGREVTRAFVTDLVRNKITIVSGMARGIDAEAHRVALEAGGRTIAVLGSGIDIIYPPEHDKLAGAIAQHGALVTEYPVGTTPEAVNFPPRNRIISGLSLGVLLVEGDETSGAVITADYALEHDREVFAVPGNIFRRESRGPNKLIRESRAKSVMRVQDILEELNLTLIAEQAEARAAVPDNETEATLLRYLSTEPVHVDELRQQSGLPIAQVSSTLALMELKGLVRQSGGMNYVLARDSTAKYSLE